MLKITPYPYQQEGIDYGVKKKRFLIADEPGLGKTLQSIATVDKADAYPCLVICPSSLKINWQREFEKFTDKSVLVLEDSVKQSYPYLIQMGGYSGAIVNYESLRKYFVWNYRKGMRLKDIVFSPNIKMFKSVIIDESHRVKDASIQQAKFCRGITVGKPYIILLSGTPAVNKPDDLTSQLGMMDRLNDFGGQSYFISKYRTGDLKDLSDKLYQTCMIRREKKNVLKDLPEKTRVDLLTDVSDSPDYEAYRLAAEDLAEFLRQYKSLDEGSIKRRMQNEALMKFMTLRGLIALCKIKPVIEYVSDFTQSGQKIVLFCSYHEVVDRLKTSFPNAVTVTGRDSMSSKQAAVDLFQNDPDVKVIICSIKAAGVGLTLTAASTVLFLEFPWTFADCVQCEDRVHRIGQTDNVLCLYFLAKGSVDHKLYKIIQDKKHIASCIVGGEDNIPQDRKYFEELISII